jgi:Zn-dependent M28 family amino/carboxypeptidase
MTDPDAPHRRSRGCRGARPVSGVRLVDPVVAAVPPGETAPDVVAALDALDRDRFLADLRTLAAHPTRRSDSAGFDDAATWAAGQLEQAGFAVSTQPVPRGGGRCRNVVGDRPGTGPESRGVVLVTAHLDSINLAGATEPAPGADDNGSGSAGLLTLARALAGRPTPRDLRMILFGGEEEGLFGSLTYVDALPEAERTRIHAVVNMDMIGCRNGAEPGVLLEGAAVAQDVLDGLARAAATYTALQVRTSLHPFNSDHVPFLDAGIPAVLTIEADDETNPRPHTAADTVDTIDADLALAILRMNLAYLLDALGRE